MYDEFQDGQRNNPWGPNVKGIVIYDRNGRLSYQIIADDRAKFNNNPRIPVAQAIGLFRTYSVSEADHTLTVHIERWTLPN